MSDKIDPKKFNTDPKHEQDRQDFDELLHGGLTRLEAKRKKENPPEDENFFDKLFKNLLGS